MDDLEQYQNMKTEIEELRQENILVRKELHAIKERLSGILKVLSAVDSLRESSRKTCIITVLINRCVDFFRNFGRKNHGGNDNGA